MTKQFYKTIIQVEILSEGEIVPELPADKLLSYLEYEGNFGHFSNFVHVVSSQPITKKELKEECIKHGTSLSFFLDAESNDTEAPDDLEQDPHEVLGI